ncbi:acetolactate synthase small subunit [Marinicella sp. W31]|uniref:acetolactate synthase small subunit n=1 Tax=Marinicella sp. W31 TaxID=3023713 RepID=UPI0037580B8B
MKTDYTIIIDSDNKAGVLNRISSVFSRIKLNIESLSVCQTEKTHVYRHSIRVFCDKKTATRICQQLNKQIEVIEACFHKQEDILQQEMALYKIPVMTLYDQARMERILRHHGAKVLSMHSEYVVIEKTGLIDEIQRLFDELQPLGILECARTGPIGLTKPATHATENITIASLKIPTEKNMDSAVYENQTTDLRG